jgi:hypothetical protein
VLVVHPSVPVSSVAEFVAFAKKEPIAYAHGGNGTPGHLTMEYFRLMAGFQTTPVPYRGNPQLVTDLVGGQIKAGFVAASGVIQHVREGRLKGLAVLDALAVPACTGRADDRGGRISGSSNSRAIMCWRRRRGFRSRSRRCWSARCCGRWQTLSSGEIPRAGHRDCSGHECRSQSPHRIDLQLWAKVVKAAGMQVD